MDIIKRNVIIEWVKRISQSEVSIAKFFTDYEVPFSKAQYFIYKKQLEIAGSAGLKDGRTRGGNRKLNHEAEAFLLGCVTTKSDVTLEWLQKSLHDKLRYSVSLSSISRAIKRISKIFSNFYFLHFFTRRIAGYDFGPNQFKFVFMQKLSDRFCSIFYTELFYDISSDLLQVSRIRGLNPTRLGLLFAQIGLLGLVLE